MEIRFSDDKIKKIRTSTEKAEYDFSKLKIENESSVQLIYDLPDKYLIIKEIHFDLESISFEKFNNEKESTKKNLFYWNYLDSEIENFDNSYENTKPLDCTFQNCTFNNNLTIDLSINLYSLLFFNTVIKNKLSLLSDPCSTITLNHFKFEKSHCKKNDNEFDINTIIEIENIKILNNIILENINILSFNYTCVDFLKKIINYEETNDDINRPQHIILRKTKILDEFIIDSDDSFFNYFNITDSTINKLFIKNTKIKQIESINKRLEVNSFFFHNMIILEAFQFYNRNENQSITFKDCTFKEKVIIDDCDVEELKIEGTTFNDFVSIQNITTNTISIDNTVFEKFAFFDGLKIKDIKGSSSKTIRTIKQQFQKADNQIEYDRFKGYELEIHRQTIDRKKDFKNWSRLWISDYYSKQGTDWIRALIITLGTSFGFYVLFYFFENLKFNCCYTPVGMNDFNIKELGSFLNSFASYLIPTSYTNPLSDPSKVKFNSIAGGICFFLGKVLLGIGIFETIKSFRKFKI